MKRAWVPPSEGAADEGPESTPRQGKANQDRRKPAPGQADRGGDGVRARREGGGGGQPGGEGYRHEADAQGGRGARPCREHQQRQGAGSYGPDDATQQAGEVQG